MQNQYIEAQLRRNIVLGDNEGITQKGENGLGNFHKYFILITTDKAPWILFTSHSISLVLYPNFK